LASAADIIKLALKDIQVLDESETPSAALMADSLTTLNQMLGIWRTNELYVYATTEITHAMTGALSYTIGLTGADITASPPIRINYAFHTQDGVDYPMMEILNTFDDYQAISLKAITSNPTAIFYNPLLPNGTIYIYPQPTTGTLHLGIDVELPNYSVAAEDLVLPVEYELAVRFNLAKILLEMMGKQLTPGMNALANNSLRMLQRSNLRVPELKMHNYRGLDSRKGAFYRGPV
jgi:hypothetical protein